MKEDRRTRISDSARDLFSTFGYKSVSMDQIAQKAQVAKGTLYLYYKDKDDLFFHLVKELLAEIKDFVESVEAKHLALLDEIHEVVYNLLMLRTKQKFLYRIANEARELKTPSACSMMNMIEDQMLGYLERKLKDATKKGIIKPCNTAVLSFAIFKVYTALAFEWEVNHEPLDEKQIAESVSIFLKDGLLCKTA